jgi:hypothetical protein
MFTLLIAYNFQLVGVCESTHLNWETVNVHGLFDSLLTVESCGSTHNFQPANSYSAHNSHQKLLV